MENQVCNTRKNIISFYGDDIRSIRENVANVWGKESGEAENNGVQM